MEQNIENAVATATPTNIYQETIATMKNDRAAFLKDLNAKADKIRKENWELKQRILENKHELVEIEGQKEIVYKNYRKKICEVKELGLEHYSDGHNMIGLMLHRFFEMHPEIHEIWNTEKDAIWHEVMKGDEL